ncbi:MAG: hypothetical protein EZS28_047123, partial [Streblomastix strix]
TPGNGKKMMGNAFSTEGQLLFVSISLEIIAGEKDQDYAKNIGITFEQAEKIAPSVLFIEGIDKMIGDGTSDRAKLIMNELEKQMSIEVQQSEIDQMAIDSKGFSYFDLAQLDGVFSILERKILTVESILKLIQIINQKKYSDEDEEEEEEEEEEEQQQQQQKRRSRRKRRRK